MKQTFMCALLVLLSCSVCAQVRPPDPAPVTATTLLDFPLYTLNVAPIPGATLGIVGRSGQQTYCYWAVTHYQIGDVESALGCISNGPNTLSPSNYVQISPYAYPALSLSSDILRTTSPIAPGGSCNCAVATGVTSGAISDQSNSLSSYTISLLDPNKYHLTLTNEVTGTAQSHLILRQGWPWPGTMVCDLSTGCGTGGGITGVTPGAGLNGGGTSGNVPVALNVALPNGETAATQTLGDNSTKVATDAFVIANAGSGLPPLTAGQLAVGTSSSPAAQNKWVIDVRDYGVKCDGSTDDTTAMNNAFAAAVAVGTTAGATAYVKIPAGICKGHFTIVQGKGLKIQGAGELSTHLRSPDAAPALQINGLWYSSFNDLTFDTTLGATNAILEIDGDYDGTHTQKVQFVSFRDILVSGVGTSDGLKSTYATAVCRQSGGNCQGSNLLFENSGMSGASSAVYYQTGYNALGNQIIGGDFQNYTLDGLYILNGTINVIGGTTFETANGCTQLLNGGVDIHTSGGSYPTQVISGIRSEGWTLINAPQASIDAIAQTPAWVSYLSNHAFSLNTPIEETGADGLQHLYCMTTAGTTGGSPPTWPATGTVADGTSVWTEETYNAVTNPGWFNSSDSHLDVTASLNWVGWNLTLGSYTLTSSGLIDTGTFDTFKPATAFTEHAIQNQNSQTILDLYANSQGISETSQFRNVSPLPASSVGILTRGGIEKLYLGDNLYEGTDGGTYTTAQYHVNTTMNVDGTFAASSGSTNFSAFFAQPTINQTGSASGSATILGVYPVLTATKGTPLLVGVGTATSAGGTRTNLFTVDPSGNISAAGQIRSTIATGTSPLSVASTTNVANLNASSLNGATFASPGAIGGTTPGSIAATTISASGQISSTLASGTAPFNITSTTPVTNLTVSNHPEVYEAGVLTTGEKIYTNTQALTIGAATHTFANSFSFTSSATFGCTCTDQTLANACSAVPASANTVTLAGTGSDVLWLSCSGH